MPTFDYTFTVDAPLSAVADFHSRTDILKRLTPPPLFVQVHEFGEMRDGMVAKFTMWFGPVPVRWRAEHVDVNDHGFTDIQRQGPLATWRHRHQFSAESSGKTRIHEHIEYTHPGGVRGIFTRLFFGKPGLYALFTYRKLITRWSLR
jgi:ligand-binding SRPBCC domain-containing protein